MQRNWNNDEAKAIVFHSHGVGQLVSMPSFPRKGETVWTGSWEIGTDGAKGSNVAVTLGNLGINTALIAKVGNDIWADIGMKYLEDANLNLSHFYKTDEIKTQIGMVIVDETGDNSIILGGNQASFSDVEIIKSIDAFKNAEYLITGFEIAVNNAIDIAKYASKCGKKVVLNSSPSPEKPLGKLDYVYLLIVNESEIDDLLHLIGLSTNGSWKNKVIAIKDNYGCENVILTLGEEGSILYTNNTIYLIPAERVKAVDTSGAGDSFIGALTAALIHGHSLEKSCRYASMYAAETVMHSGTFPAFATYKYMAEKYPLYKDFKRKELT